MNVLSWGRILPSRQRSTALKWLCAKTVLGLTVAWPSALSPTVGSAGPATYETIGEAFTPYSMSANGEMIAGVIGLLSSAPKAVIFDGEFHELPLPEDGSSFALAWPWLHAMSGDGSILAGKLFSASSGVAALYRPIYWDAERKPHVIEVPTFPQGEALGVSRDGSFIVGRGFATFEEAPEQAFVWENGQVDLLATPVGANSKAHAISDDGDWIVGSVSVNVGTGSWPSFRDLPAVWHQGVQEYLPLLPDWKSGEALVVSPEGDTAIGLLLGSDGDYVGAHWLRNGSTWEARTFDAPLDYAFDLTPDGTILVGQGYDVTRQDFDGVLWREGAGGIFLQDYLASQGLSGVTTIAALVSDDGRTIVGSTDPYLLGGNAWRLRLATPDLVGDANGDCQVGAADYALWAAQFGQTGAGLSADFDGNGSVGAGDYTLWAANFGKTCEASAAGVPEPSTELLAAAALGILGLGACTRRGGFRRLRRQPT